MGIIEKKYDVGISSCGGQLNNLVVDSYENGQRVVEYLREQKIGKMTIYPLDQMMRNFHTQSQKQFSCPPNSQRLFDLIQVQDQRIKSIFYMVFRDTLIVDDHNMANHIGYLNKMRVVTLDGMLIEQSGLISGGGHKKSGLMGDKYGATYLLY